MKVIRTRIVQTWQVAQTKSIEIRMSPDGEILHVESEDDHISIYYLDQCWSDNIVCRKFRICTKTIGPRGSTLSDNVKFLQTFEHKGDRMFVFEEVSDHEDN